MQPMTQEKKGLTENEWQELLALEYVLTWNYTDNHGRDERRYMALSDRHWNHGVAFDENQYYKNIFKK